MSKEREYDVVVYGATGYTGKLVAEYMHMEHTPMGIKWAVAGRSEDKLAKVAVELGLPDSVGRIVADAEQPDSLARMACAAKVVITTVGPYTYYGEPLVKACVEAGTDYVDLCGEVLFMYQMIDKYDEAARSSGARIVFSCGFDSIPFDLGVAFAQEKFIAAYGHPANEVRSLMRAMEGSFSGGTAASLGATMEEVGKDPSLFDVLVSAFGLTPGFDGPPQPDYNQVREDPITGSWMAPFVMAVINSKNVHRSNQLSGFLYGKDFVYDEMVMTGPGNEGKTMAEALASVDLFRDGPQRKPGEGPSKEERENGFYDVLIVASDGSNTLKVSVNGDKDPGYGSTSKMISESALYLAEGRCEHGGGVLTPAAAFGTGLVGPLTKRAGLTFGVEE